MVDKRPIGYTPGKPYFLDKKPPKSHKYDKIQGTFDTGFTAKNVEVISDQAIAKRKNELFKRIKGPTLARLLQQENPSESIYQLKGSAEEETDNNILKPKEEENKQQMDNQSVFSHMTQKTQKSGVSNFTAITYATDKISIHDRSSFIMLDLRERDEFELFHIKESLNFPAPNIGRDKFSAEMFAFKNKPGKIIVIYALDERSQIPHATLLWQKGFENIYLLTGGIEDFLQNYPENIEGKKVPVLPKKPEKKSVILRSNYKENKSNNSDLKNFENKDLAFILPPEPNSPANETSIPDNKSTFSKKNSTTTSKVGFGSSSKK